MRDPNFSSLLTEKNNGGLNSDSRLSFNPELDDDTRIELIQKKFKDIMEILGMNLEDDSLKDSPRRIAQMYVKEIFSGLNAANKPSITLFKNSYNYKQMLIVKDITLYSTCEHHFVPIIGKAHVAYYSTGNVIGLSKLNRIVQYYSKKPQVQERLTEEIAKELMNTLNTKDVAVMIEADHLCVKARGVKDVNSSTITASYNGRFLEQDIKKEFLDYIK